MYKISATTPSRIHQNRHPQRPILTIKKARADALASFCVFLLQIQLKPEYAPCDEIEPNALGQGEYDVEVEQGVRC